MKFYLVDRIVSLEPGKKIVAIKNLTGAEEYLADHFPTFPVMPGVMMLEACVQSAAWLVRLMTDWSLPLIDLRTARNVRYANFVAPGDTLKIQADFEKAEGGIYVFKCVGSVNDSTTVAAKIELRAQSLAAVDPSMAWADKQIVEQMKLRFKLCGGEELLAVMCN